MYEVFGHTADLGLRIRSADLNGLFEEAGRALFSVIVGHLDQVRPVEELRLAIEGQDLPYLFFDWLDELLYRFDAEHLLFCQFAVEVTDQGLTATVRGEAFDPSYHRLEHEVKAITYHELKVEMTADGWLAEVIVDI